MRVTTTETPRALGAEIARLTGESAAHGDMYGEILLRLARACDGIPHTAFDAIAHLRTCQTPELRAVKDCGVLRRPGAWITGELARISRAAGVGMPRPPAGAGRAVQ